MSSVWESCETRGEGLSSSGASGGAGGAGTLPGKKIFKNGAPLLYRP